MYKVTNGTIFSLMSENLPVDLMHNLDQLKNEPVMDESSFISMVTNLIGKENSSQYIAVILDNSKRTEEESKKLAQGIYFEDEEEGEGAEEVDNEAMSITGSGGPDGGNYVWMDSDEPGGPTFNWTDISGTGTAVSLGDDESVLVTIPFDFVYYGETKTEVSIASNGYLTFGTTGDSWSNASIPNAGVPNDIICPFWDDLNPLAGGTVHYLSTASQFIVQFTNVPRFSAGSLLTFQVVLYDNGSILYQYYDMQGTLNSSTIGIENSTGSDGLQVVFNGDYVHNNLAVLFSLPASCPWITSVTPMSGNVSGGGSQQVTVDVDAAGLTTGAYECHLTIYSNAVNNGKVDIPVTLNVLEPCIELVTNTTQTTTYCTLQDAIADANANDNITIGTGTLIESGQIVIDKNLTITGDGKTETFIKPDFNTGDAGDTRGWWLVNAGVELNLSGLTLDGTGYLIYQAIRTRGSGLIDNVRFTQIKYEESGPSYNGTAVAAFGTGNVDITNSTFDEIGRDGVLYFGAGFSGATYSNNSYIGKGAGDHLDYGVEIGAGAIVLVNGSTFTDNLGVASADGATSGGILVSTYFGLGTDATISDNLFTNNSTGVIVGADASDESVVSVNENNFVGNGFGVTSSAPLVDAKFNYWNSEYGPTHASNVCGTGDAVSDNVTFIPYYTDETRTTLRESCSSSGITLPFTETWENNNGTRTTNGEIYSAAGYSWTFETNAPDKCRVQWGTNAFLDHDGNGALTMDKYPSTSIASINYSILTIDLSSYTLSTGLELSFWWADHGDEEHPNDKVWIRGSNQMRGCKFMI